jgi:hypothetical protein
MLGILESRGLVPQLEDVADAILGLHAQPAVEIDLIHLLERARDASRPLAAAAFCAGVAVVHDVSLAAQGMPLPRGA